MNKIILVLLMVVLGSCLQKKNYEVLDEVETKSLKVKELGIFDLGGGTKLLNDRKELVLGMLEPSYDPYVGEVLLPPKCRKENLPKPKTTDDPSAISLEIGIYSSKEKVLGNCPDPKTVVKTLYQVLYCKESKELFSASYFYQDSNPWRKEALIKCP